MEESIDCFHDSWICAREPLVWPVANIICNFIEQGLPLQPIPDVVFREIEQCRINLLAVGLIRGSVIPRPPVILVDVNPSARNRDNLRGQVFSFPRLP